MPIEVCKGKWILRCGKEIEITSGSEIEISPEVKIGLQSAIAIGIWDSNGDCKFGTNWDLMTRIREMPL